MKYTLLCVTCCLLNLDIYSQILHSENFNVIIDTTKTIKGNFLPSFRYRNLRENYLEIENVSDIAVRLGKHGFTIANKLEFSRFGNEPLYSGGFLYLEYSRILEKNKLVIEPYAQVQWKEARGLKIKFASGANLRYRMIMNKTTGLFGGIGLFYEHEKWNYLGVPGSQVEFIGLPDIERNIVRMASYLSLKKLIADKIELDFSWYYQPRVNLKHHDYRLATSSQVTYKFSEHVGFNVLYQNVFDPNPVVPVNRLFHDISFGLSLSF